MKKINHSIIFGILYYWGKFVGLNPLNLSEDNEVNISYFSFCYGCFLGGIYSYTFYRVFNDRLRTSLPGETPIAIIVFFIWISSGFLQTVLTWLVFAFRQNRIHSIVKKFVKVQKISRKLGIFQDYETHFRKLGIPVAVTNIFYIGTIAFTLAILSRHKNFHTALWITYDIPRLISLDMEVLFVWSLNVVKEQFHRLNEKLLFVCTKNYCETHVGCKKESRRLLRDLSCSCSLYRFGDKITMISKLHRQLRDVLRLIQMHFSMLMLVGIAVHFTHITLNCYLIYRYINDRDEVNGMDYLFISPLIIWLIASVAILTMISNVCGSTSRKANETGNILHEGLNNCINVEKSQENANIFIFSLDLLQNPVDISLYGFLQLNYIFVFSTLASVGPYLIIMLQFNS